MSRKIEMRWPDELVEAVDAAADGAEVSRSEWVRQTLGDALGMNGGMKQAATAPKPAPTKATKRIAALTACPHRNKERLGYMTRCGDCGERLR